ncbi:hypothetical protein LWI28_025821 [Acer negundo]|uniref:Uncharacterized protein n=1 Tax=Acer negundo TaxID=4023 RepID=A0AAD5NT22_ACENE|nr:hypothetical protein LWI28_025821 [Acer negundo]
MVPPYQHKTKSADALKKCDQDPHVIAAVAKLFWHDRKVVKARNWLIKAVTLALDIGDFWALSYKFELKHGSEDDQKDVLKKCIAAEPKHGERWQAISKAVENSHQPTEAILKKVVVALGKEESSAENIRRYDENQKNVLKRSIAAEQCTVRGGRHFPRLWRFLISQLKHLEDIGSI